MKIYLARHGQDEDNANKVLNGRRNKPLTELGKRQAEKLAQHLENENIEIILSSPLIRAKETAEIVAGSKGLTVTTHPLLIERDFGVLTGRAKKEIPNYAKGILKTKEIDYFLDVNGAEKFPQLLERAKRFLADIETKYTGKNILVVAHGDIAKMILAAFKDITWKEALLTPNFENAGFIVLE